MVPRRRMGAIAGAAAAVAVWAVATISSAQIIVKNAIALPAADGVTAKNEPTQNVFVPPERRILLQLANARRLLEAGRYGEAVRALGSILDGPEDYFFQPTKGGPIYRSLKTEAQRLIGQMPREGRELYERQYGARARHRLDQALSSGDADGLAEVARRFFHTQSGYEATLLLGLDHLDHGRPLAGALSLRRLRKATASSEQFEPTLSFALATCWLQAGMPEKAREVLSALKEQLGGTSIEVAGTPIPWFADEGDAVAWLAGVIGPDRSGGPMEADSWVMFRGNPSRNATTAASAAWCHRLPLENSHHRRSPPGSQASGGSPDLPGPWHPCPAGAPSAGRRQRGPDADLPEPVGGRFYYRQAVVGSAGRRSVGGAAGR